MSIGTVGNVGAKNIRDVFTIHEIQQKLTMPKTV